MPVNIASMSMESLMVSTARREHRLGGDGICEVFLCFILALFLCFVCVLDVWEVSVLQANLEG